MSAVLKDLSNKVHRALCVCLLIADDVVKDCSMQGWVYKMRRTLSPCAARSL